MQTFFDILDFFSNSPFIIYPVILLCTFSACRAIGHYFPKTVKYYNETPWKIIITFCGSILGYAIYQSMHIICSKEIQTLFHMSPNQLPHTLSLLTLILCIPAWLFVIGIFFKIGYLYTVWRDKKTTFFQHMGLNVLSIICIVFAYKFALKLTASQELIRQMATQVDYLDKKFLPSAFAQQEDFDGFLIIDEQTISIYQKNNNITRFKIIKNTA